MAAVALGVYAYRRQSARLPEIRLVNRYLERNPANLQDGVAVLPRPGLVELSEVGDGPIRAVFRQSGCFDGDYLIVSGAELYRMPVGGSASLIGTVGGAERVEIAADGTNALIAAGPLYAYDGTSLSTVATPDDVEIVSVATINGYFVLQVADSGRFYWLPPVDTTIDALDFATAERWPDAGVSVRTTVDELWFLNEQSVEVWAPTGNADAPFQRIEGRLFEWGCAARSTVVNLDNTVFWVSERAQEGRVVLKGDAVPEVISTNGISERLNSATELSAFTFAIDGHEFYVLRIGGHGTFAYDVTTGTWSQFASYGREQWRPWCAAAAPGAALVLGDDESGQLWTLDPEVGNDDGQPIVRVVTGGIPIVGERGVVANVSISASVGWSPDHDLEPQIELRTARDGFTFGAPRARSLGRRGQFDKRVRWEQLGEIVPPGMVLEFTDSDDCQTTIFYCRANEAY